MNRKASWWLGLVLIMAPNLGLAGPANALFRSLDGKSPSTKANILRQIAMLKDPETLANFGLVMLNPDEEDDARREAAKAILSLKNDTMTQRAFIPLLQENEITIDKSLDAIWMSGGMFFIPGLVNLANLSKVEIRKRALLTTLALWDAKQCDGSFLLLNTNAPKKSSSKRSRGHYDRRRRLAKDQEKLPDDPITLLLEISTGQQSNNLAELNLKALFLLSCIENGEGYDALLKKLRDGSETERFYIGRFLGGLQRTASIAVLGDCGRSDVSARVRRACVESLVAYDMRDGSEAARLQLVKTYKALPVEDYRSDKEDLVTILQDVSLGKHELKKLLAIEKDERLRELIRKAL